MVIRTAEAMARAASRERIVCALSRMLPDQADTGALSVISGGFTNLNWHLRAEDGRSFFIKDPGANGSPFINRETAREAAHVSGALGIAPEMLNWDRDTGIELHAFLDGYHEVSPNEMRGPLGARVMKAYALAHGHGMIGQTKTGLDQIEEHLDQLRSAGVLLPVSFIPVLAGYEEAARALRASGIDLTMCYNDGHISNYLLNDAGDLKVIDWEYAANNCRYWDIGLFALEMFFDPPEVRRLITAYEGDCRPEIYARVQVWRLLAGVKWSLWALIQAHASPLSFDFRKYAEALNDRVGFEMALPEWQAWLRSL